MRFYKSATTSRPFEGACWWSLIYCISCPLKNGKNRVAGIVTAAFFEHIKICARNKEN
jgi:hypothetical protein